MADFPSVLFISLTDLDPEDFIKLIMDVSELPEKIHIDKNTNAFPWVIDNKYYTAELRLCSLKEKSVISEKFSDSVEAIIIHFDSSKKYALEEVDTWLPLIDVFQPEIKILVCNSVPNEDKNSGDLSKRMVLKWCIGKRFELVELEPISDGNDELGDDCQEATGIKRIVQALNAHVWPNLIMKNSTQKLNPSIKSQDRSCNKMNNLREQVDFTESLDELLEKDDDFSQLFSQLSEMKDRISTLSGSDRKAAAEKVVKAFWNALNIEDADDEFLDL